MSTTCLQEKEAAVLSLLRQGLRPIPNWWPLPGGRCACGDPECDSPGKHPIPTWKPFQNRPPTEAEVLNWLEKYPEANWGIVLGEDAGLIVVDFDGDGAEGLLQEEGIELPACATWRSPGGAKVLLRHPGGSLPKKIRLLEGDGCGVDLLADGCQVVVPPSRHRRGLYGWVIPLSEGIGEAPAALLALARATSPDNGKAPHPLAAPIGDSIPDGTRDRALASIAGSMRRRGVSPEGILAALRVENARCVSPKTEADLQRIAKSIGRYAPAPVPSAMVTEHLTDLGNARRLMALYGDRFRWCGAWQAFLVYDGTRWVRDDSGQVMRWAKETVKALYAEAADMADEAQRKAFAAYAIRSESVSRLQAMVNLVKSEQGIPVSPDVFDQNPWVLNCLNGMVELRTGQIREHRAADFMTKMAPVEYDPTATAPIFAAFLKCIFAGTPDMVGFLRQAIGYSLTGQTIEQCWFLLHGIGANGKSTLLRTLIDLLGDYASWTPAQTLLAKRGEGINNDQARLRGARFVAAVETDGGRRLSEALVKQMTGGDKIAARFLYGEFFDFAPEFKLWLATNHKPEIRGTDHATWRRIRLIPFTVTIPELEQDKQLLEKLRAEFPGILRWAVDGCLAWQREGLGLPDAVREATAEYRASMDVIGQFIGECCAEDPAEVTRFSDLYRAYMRWCEKGNETVEGSRQFGEALKERGYPPGKRGTGGAVTRKGIKLGSEWSESSEPLFGKSSKNSLTRGLSGN